jgi:small conductance mechanosensitive channel
MLDTPAMSQILRELSWQHLLLVLAVVIAARILVSTARLALSRAAERVPARFRLTVLKAIPVSRIGIWSVAIAFAGSIVVEPTLGNIVALAGSIGLALAFTLKDYASSLAGGLAAILENTFQLGDWIEIDGVYGEVEQIANRAVHIVTPDDTRVIIPHAQLWSKSVSNATTGNRSVLCVADFYLHPDHDGGAVHGRLAEIAEGSRFRKADTPVTVIVHEKPWGTHYRLKAYVEESREQFMFTTDLTLRGKAALRAINIRFAQVPVAIATAS